MHEKIKETIENILSDIIIGQVKLQECEMNKQNCIEFLELCRLEDQFKEYKKNIEKEERGEKEENDKHTK